ncbi:MAG: hypothetical protein LBR72_05455 [Oscillospiraceae bacterium]|jgi:hypothetical protein|nr:hypothetical protein [Oscillospiraceae bacterium]
MKIIRAGFNDADIFSRDELNHGACCFFTEDRRNKFVFRIEGTEATLFADSMEYVDMAMSEFLFYSGFVTTVKDKFGNVLMDACPDKPYLMKISQIQPSQFYINEAKLIRCKLWIKRMEDIFIPIVEKEGRYISLDGHTRMRAALDLGFDSVYVYHDGYDADIFFFADEAARRNIHTVSDMEILSDDNYTLKWHKYCDDFFGSTQTGGGNAP